MDSAPIREFRRYIRQIEREVEYHLKNQSDCCGVTMAKCHVLMELDDMGTTSIVDLAKRLRLDTSTLSRTVDSLVREMYVGRTINPANRRFVEVKLTDKGQKKASDINSACDSFYHDLVQRVPGGQASIMEAARWLSEVLAQKHDNICCADSCGG
jgi:DNA-binding MarR family transcriptional regulator